MAAVKQESPSFLQDADALAAQSEAPSFLADADALMQQAGPPGFLADADAELTKSEKNIFGKDAASLTGQAFRESLLEVPSGRERVNQLTSRGDVDLLRLTFPNLPFGLGREPKREDFDQAAEKYADFRPIWESLKQRQATSREYADALYGANPNWNSVERAWLEDRFDREAISGKLRSDEKPKVKPEIGVTRKFATPFSVKNGSLSYDRPGGSLLPGAPPMASQFDAQVGEWSQELRRDGIPGVNRPPLSDDEIVAAAIAEVQGRASVEVESLPSLTKGFAKGAGAGLRMGAVIAPVGRAARAAGAIGKAVAPVAEGAALSAAEQALGIATGARKDFSFGEVIAAASALKLGSVAGQRLAVRFPEAKRLMGTLGTLGTVEAVNRGLNIAKTGQLPLQGSDHPGSDLVEGLVEAATSIGVAARMGAAESGKPKVDLTEATRASGKANFEAVQTTREALEAAIRKKTGLDPDKPKLDKIEQKTIRATLGATVESVMHAQKFDRWLDEKSGSDPAKKAALQLDVLRAMEAFDAKEQPDLATPPEVLSEGVAILKQFGAAGLKIGEIRKNQDAIVEVRLRPKSGKDLLGGNPDGSEDVTAFKSEIDSGEAMVPGLDGGAPQPIRHGVIPKGWELVGGYDFHAKRGFYFPQMSPERDLPSERSPFAKGAKRTTRKDQAGASHEQTRRDVDFETALRERALDIDIRNASKVFEDQAGNARDRMFLDLAAEEGFVLRRDQLPNAAVREQAAAESEALTKRNLVLEAALRKKEIDPLKQQMASAEILGNKRRIAELKNVMAEDFYKEAKGKEWGDYEGMFMHPSVMYRARQFIGGKTPGQHLATVINSAVKQNLVGSNLKTYIQDFLGNYVSFEAAGIDALGQMPEAWGIENKARAGARFPAKDADNIAFDILAKRTALGGPTDITAAEQAEESSLLRDLAEAKKTGDKTAMLKTARAAEVALGTPNWLLGGFLKKKFGFAGVPKWLSNKRIHMIDRAQARAAFLEMVRNGVDGSGPLDWTDAFDRVRRIADYGRLPGGLQTAAQFFSMIRYPSKVVQSLGSVMERRPTIFGEPIPTPMDAVIEAQPGTPAAQRALLARGMTRIALVTAKYAVPITAIAQTMFQQTGISKKELDTDLDAKLAWMSPPASALTKQFAVPTGRDGAGNIEYLDGASMFPPVVALRYFWLNFSGDSQPWYMQAAQSLAQKNVIAGPAYNVATRRDFAGRNTGEGYDRFKPIVQGISPAMVMQPLEAYFQMEGVPEEERNALRSLLRSVAGVPIEVARDPTFSDKTMVPLIGELMSQGVIGHEDRDDGSSGLYIRKEYIGTPQEQMAQDAIATYANLRAANPRSAAFKLKQLLENTSR